jgi:hypothetical protein
VQATVPAAPPVPPESLEPVVPAWLLAGPAAPMLRADGNVDPALASPPPPGWCEEHGWGPCPRHAHAAVAPVEAAMPRAAAVEFAPPRFPSPTPTVVEVGAGTPLLLLPSVTRTPDMPRVHVREGDALAFVSAPTGASAFAFGAGVSSFTSAAATDAVAPPRLPSPTPATPPPSPRTGARRRLTALGLPLSSPPSSGRGRRSGGWSPAVLGLSSGLPNGVASTPGGSSPEGVDGAPGTSARRR